MNSKHEDISSLEWKEMIAFCDVPHRIVSQIFLQSSVPWSSVTVYSVTFLGAFLVVASVLHLWAPLSLYGPYMMLLVLSFWSSSPLTTPTPHGSVHPELGFYLQASGSQINISSLALTPDSQSWRSVGLFCLDSLGPLRIRVPPTVFVSFHPPLCPFVFAVFK